MEGCGDRSESGTVSGGGHPPAHVCCQDSIGSTTAFSVSDLGSSPVCPLPFPQAPRVVKGHSDSSNGTFNMGSIPWASEHLGLALSVSCTTSSGSLHLPLLLLYHLGTPGTRRPFPGEGKRPGLPPAGGDRIPGVSAHSALGRLGCPLTPFCTGVWSSGLVVGQSRERTGLVCPRGSPLQGLKGEGACQGFRAGNIPL